MCAHEAIRRLAPYLRRKRPEADLAMKYVVEGRVGWHPGPNGIPAGVVAAARAVLPQAAASEVALRTPRSRALKDNMTFATRHGTRPRAANRDLITQLQRLRELTRSPALTRAAEDHTEELPAPATPQPDQRSLFDSLAMVERQTWAKTLRGDSGETMQATLKRASDLGASRRVAKAPDVSAFAELRRDFPNFDPVTSILERRASLCRRARDELYRLPPLLLSGPPGIGRSA